MTRTLVKRNTWFHELFDLLQSMELDFSSRWIITLKRPIL